MPHIRSKKTNSSSKKSIPGLVYHTIALSKSKIKKKSSLLNSKNNSKTPIKSSNPNLKSVESNKNYSPLLLWGSVVSSFMIILVVSGLALKTKFSSLNWFTAPEKILLDKSTYSWNKVDQATKFNSDIEQEIQKAEVKNAIQNFLTTTSTGASSTPEVVATTTSST